MEQSDPEAGSRGSLLPILDPTNKPSENQRNFPDQATLQNVLPEQNSVIQTLLDQLNPSTLNLLNAGASMTPPVSSVASVISSHPDKSNSRIHDFACLEGL